MSVPSAPLLKGFCAQRHGLLGLQETESAKCQEMGAAVNELHPEAPSRYNDRDSVCAHCMPNKLH